MTKTRWLPLLPQQTHGSDSPGLQPGHQHLYRPSLALRKRAGSPPNSSHGTSPMTHRLSGSKLQEARPETQGERDQTALGRRSLEETGHKGFPSGEPWTWHRRRVKGNKAMEYLGGMRPQKTFCKLGPKGPERGSDWLKVTELVSGLVGTRVRSPEYWHILLPLPNPSLGVLGSWGDEKTHTFLKARKLFKNIN